MHLPLTPRKTTEETTEEQMTNDIKDAIFAMMEDMTRYSSHLPEYLYGKHLLCWM